MEEFLNASACNEYKTRNILSLADRIQVINEYDSSPTRPSFQSLATKYDCSSKQIKNILQGREAILKTYHESGESINKDTRDDGLQKRQEKIEFLGKVMFEYIQRMVYNKYAIDEQKVRDKALQIKECIAIENFQPNNRWFQHFKTAYGIPGFDRESLRNNVQILEAKRPHISAIDMIQYVSRQEQKEQNKDDGMMNKKLGRRSNFESFQREEGGSHARMDHRIGYESRDNHDNFYDDDGYYTGHNGNNSSSSSSSRNDFKKQSLRFSNKDGQSIGNTSATRSLSGQKRKRSDSPFPDIESPYEALKHLKALEEYAMLQDNYRAIGLLTQLEEIYKRKTKAKK